MLRANKANGILLAENKLKTLLLIESKPKNALLIVDNPKFILLVKDKTTTQRRVPLKESNNLDNDMLIARTRWQVVTMAG